MATKLAGIGVGRLSSTARYVDKFLVEIYSDSGYTTKIGSATSSAIWNGSQWNQKDYIEFNGLTFGSTYYLKGYTVAPLSGTLSTAATFSLVATTGSSAPNPTYTGTYTATVSGVNYTVTPASAPSDIKHYDVFYTFGATVPASTDPGMIKGIIANNNGNVNFFVGGVPNSVVSIWIRAVNTSMQVQAWTQLTPSITISATFGVGYTGTIADGTLVGTGGPSVNSGSTGRLGIGGAAAPAAVTNFNGLGINNQPSGSYAQLAARDTRTSGVDFNLLSGYLAAGQMSWNQSGTDRMTANNSGQYGIGGAPGVQLDVYGLSGGNYARINGTAADLVFNNAPSTGGRVYYIINESGNGLFQQYDSTAGATRTQINSTGQYGVGGAPFSDNIFSAIGNSGGAYARVGMSGNDAYLRMVGTTASREYGLYNVGGNYSLFDGTGSAQRTYLNTSGQFGIGGTPGYPADVYGSYVANRTAGNAGYWSYDTSASPATFVTIVNRGSGGYFIQDNGAGINRTQISMSGGLGIGGNPGADFYQLASNRSYFQGTGPGVALNDTQVGGRLYMPLSGSGLASAYTIYDGTRAVYPQYINSSGQWGVSGNPGSGAIDIFGNPHVQASQYDFRAQNTETSGRIFGVGSSSGWDGVGYYQTAIDHTAGALRNRMDSSGQVGFSRVPGTFFETQGPMFSIGSGSGINYQDRTSALQHAFYADAGYARIWNTTGGDVVTINRSSGNLGIGGTYTGDWISVQGTSIVDGSKNIQLKNKNNAVGSTSSASTTSNTYSVVPEMSVTITTTGNKILMTFTGSFTQTFSSTSPYYFAIFRDGTQVSQETARIINSANDGLYITAVCTYIDSPSAGSHTFDVRWRTGQGTLSVIGTNRSFQVVELG